ncbi:MAG: ATP-binding cassette domain-containing protein [Candidatus Gracilibacteria bacterium]|nr:ATP-binding cassette domain-containing protein [Candidatus Gracilibacteria bacterium]
MASNETVVRFDGVSFEFAEFKPILDDVSFNVRKGTKITLMGQNGGGKTTIFKLITGELKPKRGKIHIDKDTSIAIAQQVIPLADRELTVRAFFQKYYKEAGFNVDAKIANILEVVNLKAPLDRFIKSFSGGQQARLLLASALIQDPDILLLDEPTNNLDVDGIAHLTDFLISYKKTCMVISHDAEFLNSFTDGVIYLDVFTKKIEQYVGNYYNVTDEIAARIKKENMKNAQLAKEAQANKEQANVFAHKGGKLRLVAKKMREKAEELEEAAVDVRKEDRTIRDFTIPLQEGIGGELLKINSVKIIRDHEATTVPVEVSLRRKQHLLLSGPNGIGKSTLLESIALGKSEGAIITPGVKIGYYRQDFSNLNFDQTVYQCLMEASDEKILEQDLRSMAAGFLITGDVMKTQIGRLSEGQKGLVAFARLVLQKPGLLILDEPTNHINFRHIPVIAEALDKYEGAMILVSHVQEFVWQIRIDDELDLGSK